MIEPKSCGSYGTVKMKATAQKDQLENAAASEGAYSLDRMLMEPDFSSQIAKICLTASTLLLTGNFESEFIKIVTDANLPQSQSPWSRSWLWAEHSAGTAACVPHCSVHVL